MYSKVHCVYDILVLLPAQMIITSDCTQVIMDRLYKGVWDKVNSGGVLGQVLFQFAYKYKLQQIEKGYDTPFLNK